MACSCASKAAQQHEAGGNSSRNEFKPAPAKMPSQSAASLRNSSNLLLLQQSKSSHDITPALNQSELLPTALASARTPLHIGGPPRPRPSHNRQPMAWLWAATSTSELTKPVDQLLHSSTLALPSPIAYRLSPFACLQQRTTR